MVTTLATNTRWTGGWPVLTARYPYWPSDVERNFDPKLLRREAQGPATWAQPAFDLNHTSGGARPPSWPRSTSRVLTTSNRCPHRVSVGTTSLFHQGANCPAGASRL